MFISGDKYPDAVPCRFAWVIIRTIRHYPDELSGAVCTCLHLSCLSDGVLETKRHKTLIPLMCVYIYIYTSISLPLSLSIYIYIYIHTHIHIYTVNRGVQTLLLIMQHWQSALVIKSGLATIIIYT